jgi:hypothetical protein
MLQRKTHYEQVPVEIVKKIAEEEVQQEAPEPKRPPKKRPAKD